MRTAEPAWTVPRYGNHEVTAKIMRDTESGIEYGVVECRNCLTRSDNVWGIRRDSENAMSESSMDAITQAFKDWSSRWPDDCVKARRLMDVMSVMGA